MEKESSGASDNMRLCDLDGGQCAVVGRIDIGGTLRRRLADIGLTPGSRVECVGHSPDGEASAYLIRGALIAIRHRDGGKISVYGQTANKESGKWD